MVLIKKFLIVLNFCHYDFGFVSDFEIRISYFVFAHMSKIFAIEKLIDGGTKKAYGPAFCIRDYCLEISLKTIHRSGRGWNLIPLPFWMA
jgi:hypothetical protein